MFFIAKRSGLVCCPTMLFFSLSLDPLTHMSSVTKTDGGTFSVASSANNYNNNNQSASGSNGKGGSKPATSASSALYSQLTGFVFSYNLIVGLRVLYAF